MAYETIILYRVEQYLKKAYFVHREVLRLLPALAENQSPDWSREEKDSAGGTRTFRLEFDDRPGKVWVIGYGIDEKNSRVVITSAREKEKEQQTKTHREIRFFARKRGRAPMEEFLLGVRRSGAKGYAKVLEVVRRVIAKTIEYPHTKSIEGFEGLDEIRTDLGNLRYRIFYGFVKGKEDTVAVLLSGLIKDNQEANQREIEASYELLKIAKKSLYENSLSVDEVSTDQLKAFVSQLRNA